MKKILVILLSALSLTAVGQNEVKKVAILETVDKVGDVPYGVKLQVRMSLTYAISSTPGYEGYDRVDMASIMGEQNFQRTGMVSDAQIKKLGDMTGAQYVLIAEAAIYDAQNIIITAKVLDVETGGVANSAPPAFANKNPEQMQTACVTLAQKLLGKKSGTSTSSSYNNNFSFQVPSGYVDLGLPSGTLWKSENEDCGLITYDQAYNFYGSSLPTKEQLEELKDNCLWTWQGNGYKVKGKSGESIFLPAVGYRSCDGSTSSVGSYGSYWSSTPDDSERVWDLSFSSSGMSMYDDRHCCGLSVRLVKK